MAVNCEENTCDNEHRPVDVWNFWIMTGILKHVEEINFYVLCNDKLTYSEYI